jgi:hypothetical protein
MTYFDHNQAENPIKHRIFAQTAVTARAAPHRVFESGRIFYPVNEHLKEIRSGFLRKVGGVLLSGLLAIFVPGGVTATGLVISPRNPVLHSAFCILHFAFPAKGA